MIGLLDRARLVGKHGLELGARLLDMLNDYLAQVRPVAPRLFCSNRGGNVDHEAARQIADCVSAHAIGNRPAAGLGLVEAGIFVDFTDASDVGARGRRPAKLAGTSHNGYTVSFLLRASGETLMFEFAPVLWTSIAWITLIIWLA